MNWSPKELEWIENNGDTLNSGDPDRIITKVWKDLGFGYHKLLLSVIFLLNLPIKLVKDRFTRNWQLRADFEYSSEVMVLDNLFLLDRKQVISKLKDEVLPELGLPKEVIEYIINNL